MTSPNEPVGTFSCPICGFDKPHHHSEEQVAAWRDDEARNDGWTSTVNRQPKESGWYLCLGVEIDLDQFGEPKGFNDYHPKWSQLFWLNWVRQAGNAGHCEQKIPEVLYFDLYHDQWWLRNFLGSAVPSGAESRFPIEAQPKYWRTPPNAPSSLQNKEEGRG